MFESENNLAFYLDSNLEKNNFVNGFKDFAFIDESPPTFSKLYNKSLRKSNSCSGIGSYVQKKFESKENQNKFKKSSIKQRIDLKNLENNSIKSTNELQKNNNFAMDFLKKSGEVFGGSISSIFYNSGGEKAKKTNKQRHMVYGSAISLIHSSKNKSKMLKKSPLFTSKQDISYKKSLQKVSDQKIRRFLNFYKKH